MTLKHFRTYWADKSIFDKILTVCTYQAFQRDSKRPKDTSMVIIIIIIKSHKILVLTEGKVNLGLRYQEVESSRAQFGSLTLKGALNN